MFARKPHLKVPDDVGTSLDRYAEALSRELQMRITRQQAFERLVRTFLPEKGASDGE